MTARSPSAFLLSFALHAFVVGIGLLVGYATRESAKDLPKVFELVAGAGDNYLAREAPALGTEGGVKLSIPNTSPRPQPKKAEPTPVIPAPTPPKPEQKVLPTPTPKAEKKVPDIAQKIKQEVRQAERKAKNEVKKEREAEAKAEAKRLAEEQRRMTKEEFDRANKTKAAPPPTKSGPTKIAKIDAEGIARGVIGGSAKNKIGGASGTALTADAGEALERYYALFKRLVHEKFEAPTNASDVLEATVTVRIDANGALSNPRIVKSSGLREFDQAVIEAVRQIRMPPRPDKRSDTVQFIFAMRERDRG